MQRKKLYKTLDYSLAIACLGYGLYDLNPWWIAGGGLGLVLAYIDPARFVQVRAKSMFVKARG